MKMKITEMKTTVIYIKNSLDGISGRVEMTEEGIHELENESIKFMQYEQQRLQGLENNTNRTLETCGTTKGPIFILWECQGGEKEVKLNKNM